MPRTNLGKKLPRHGFGRTAGLLAGCVIPRPAATAGHSVRTRSSSNQPRHFATRYPGSRPVRRGKLSPRARRHDYPPANSSQGSYHNRPTATAGYPQQPSTYAGRARRSDGDVLGNGWPPLRRPPMARRPR